MDEIWLLLLAAPELSCCVLPGWLLTLVGDIAAYYTSAPNRRERRDAKSQGQPPPPRDIWSWLFLILLGVSIVLFIVFIVKSIMLMNRIKA